MGKKIVLVGHCGPDSYMLRSAVKYAVEGSELSFANDDLALTKALEDGVDLLLINRVMDGRFTSEIGTDLIKRLRQERPATRTMLISNYSDAQDAAVEAGAARGFGKGEAGSKKMRDALGAALTDRQLSA